MLDTLILQIPLNQCRITDCSKFGTTKEKMLENQANFWKHINNPTSKDKKQGIYKPRLTALKQGKRHSLKIEFSAPKLLFGNNASEVSESDFDKIVEILQKK